MLSRPIGGSGGAGPSTFLALTDTPDVYTGQGSKLLAVNSGATALEFVSKGVTITETDGAPSVNATIIKFTSGSVIDNGGGTVTINVGGGNNFDDGYFGEPETGNLIITDGNFGDGA